MSKTSTTITGLRTKTPTASMYTIIEDSNYTGKTTIEDLVNSVIGGKENTTSYITELTSSGWSSTSPYTQTVTVPNLGASQNGIISIASTATPLQREAARNAMFYIQSQSSLSLTVAADGDKPSLNIPVEIILFS